MLQKLLITYLLKPLGKLMDKLAKIVKDALFVLAGLAMLSLGILDSADILSCRYLYIYAAGCLCLGLMILSTLTGDIRPVKFHKLLSIFWLATGAFTLLSAFLYNVDFLANAIFFLIITPILFIVWNQGNFNRILRLLTTTTIIALVIIILANILFYPVTEQRYFGIFVAPNSVSYFYPPVFAFLLITLYRTEKFNWKTVGCILLLGIVVALAYYSSSRTTELAIICEFLACTFIYLVANRKEIGKILLQKLLPLALVIAVSLPGALYLFQIRPIIENAVFEQQAEATQPPEAAPAPEAVQPVESVPVELPPETIPTSPNAIHGLDSFVDMNNGRLTIEGLSLDVISSGRISVWKTYLSQLNLFGHVPGSWNTISDLGYEFSAHMVPLQYAYDSGIFCGLAFLLFNLYAGVMAVAYAWKHKKDTISLLPMTLVISFGVISAVSSAGTPFIYICTMYYVFVQPPFVTKQIDNNA